MWGQEGGRCSGGCSRPLPKLPCCLPSSPSPRARASRLAGEKSRLWSPSASYDLRERLCPGSALGSLGGPEQQAPTDEAEAQMLGSADLDDMKSECQPVAAPVATPTAPSL